MCPARNAMHRDFDSNGVIYYIGSRGCTRPFTNPEQVTMIRGRSIAPCGIQTVHSNDRPVTLDLLATGGTVDRILLGHGELCSQV